MSTSRHTLVALTFLMVTVSIAIGALGLLSLAAGNVMAALGCAMLALVTGRLAFAIR